MRTIQERLLLTHMLVALVPILGLGFFLNRALESYSRDSERGYLERQAALARDLVAGLLERGTPPPALDRILKRSHGDAGHASGEYPVRLTVIAPDGKVLADSEAEPARMENHRQRPEVAAALTGRTGTATRYSTTRRERMIYAALPLPGARGVVRAAVPEAEAAAKMQEPEQLLILAGGIAVALALLLTLRAAAGIAAPIEQISHSVRQVAAGDLSHRVPTVGLGELADLAESFNRMTARLEGSIQRIASGRSQLQTILTRMAEGIVVTDREGIIRLFNPAAEQLLGVSAAVAVGQPLLEATLSHQLADLLVETLRGERAHSREIRLIEPGSHRPGGGAVLSAYAAPIRAESVRETDQSNFGLEMADFGLSGNPHSPIRNPQSEGVVLVLRDLTETRRLEEMRQEFVANVSHELKTPITAIQALAETIQIHGANHPGLAAEYSERIVTETTRLGRLVQDLLDLAEIEGGRREVRRAIIHSQALIAETTARLADAAEAKAIQLGIGDEDLLFRADRDAVGQALFNLIDNAIRYTPAGGRVTINCRAEAGGIEFAVTDTGIGIPPEAQPRVFERFYRVDKARSRELGGTGLGLSIVKHIAEAHGGRVGLQSEPGRGSCFTLWLPRRPVEAVVSSQ